jgi:cell division protein FtsN
VTPTIAVPAIEPGAIYLQVLASREADPAREALIKYKAKGHPVALDNNEPEWFRILVGPFHEQEEAAKYQLRLKADGIESFIRQL